MLRTFSGGALLDSRVDSSLGDAACCLQLATLLCSMGCRPELSEKVSKMQITTGVTPVYTNKLQAGITSVLFLSSTAPLQGLKSGTQQV